jgi:tripartite ATP-independent transporter DctM subunit
MEWWHTLTIGLGILVALFLTGAPIFVAFLVMIVAGVVVTLGDRGFGMIVNSMYATSTTESLGAVALYILLGEILFRSGSMDVLLSSCDKLIGRVRGRQYVVSIALSTIIGSLAGSAMAVGAMLTRMLLPGMQARGYDTKLSIGTILGGALLAPIIPPSILAIIVGSLADVSISSLLVAGILPGILIAGLYIAACLVKVRIDPSLAPPNEEVVKVSGREKVLAVLGLLPFTLVLVLVMGLIVFGITTASESAATGVLGAILMAAFYRRLSVRMLLDSLSEAATLSAVLLLILVSAVMFTQLLTLTGATSGLTKVVTQLDVPAWVMFVMLMAVPFFLCMFVDQLGVMLVVIPIYLPIVKAMGFDPVWFWLQFLVNITLGAITPPFGYVLFAVKASAPKLPMREIFSASWLFVYLTLLGMLIMWIFPDIVTVLPRVFQTKG